MSEITGKVKVIGETKEFGNNSFRKRELVVITEDQYPQHILIELIQDKTELIEKFKIEEGDNVKVAINILGREWVNPQGEVKYFNSIQGWRIEKLDGGNSNEPLPQAPEPFPNVNDFEDDDTPF